MKNVRRRMAKLLYWNEKRAHPEMTLTFCGGDGRRARMEKGLLVTKEMLDRAIKGFKKVVKYGEMGVKGEEGEGSKVKGRVVGRSRGGRGVRKCNRYGSKVSWIADAWGWLTSLMDEHKVCNLLLRLSLEATMLFDV